MHRDNPTEAYCRLELDPGAALNRCRTEEAFAVLRNELQRIEEGNREGGRKRRRKVTK